MNIIQFIVLLTCLLGFAYGAITYLTYPLIWVSAGWTACFGLAAMFSPKALLKAVWVNLAFLFGLLGALETYAALSLNAQAKASDASSGPQLQTTRSQDYIGPHAILGYAPHQNSHSEVTLNLGTDIIYRVTYTFDAHGLRIAPPAEPSQCNRCVLFFGGSFTLGEGVADDEALPYQVGQQSRCPVYNFGFHGYGPHHMLAAIEKGLLADTVDCRPQAVIYQAVLDHVSRAAGLSSWGDDTPRYQATADGDVVHVGRFSDINGLADHIRAVFKQTHIYRQFFRNRIRADRDDVDRLIAIVAASEQKLKAMYPGVAFHILLWDNASGKKVKQELYDLLYAGLKRKGFKIHLVSQILSGYPQTRANYELSPLDNHPNARAYREMAVYIAHNILEEPKRKPQGAGPELNHD